MWKLSRKHYKYLTERIRFLNLNDTELHWFCTHDNFWKASKHTREPRFRNWPQHERKEKSILAIIIHELYLIQSIELEMSETLRAADDGTLLYKSKPPFCSKCTCQFSMLKLPRLKATLVSIGWHKKRMHDTYGFLKQAMCFLFWLDLHRVVQWVTEFFQGWLLKMSTGCLTSKVFSLS